MSIQTEIDQILVNRDFIRSLLVLRRYGHDIYSQHKQLEIIVQGYISDGTFAQWPTESKAVAQRLWTILQTFINSVEADSEIIELMTYRLGEN